MIVDGFNGACGSYEIEWTVAPAGELSCLTFVTAFQAFDTVNMAFLDFLSKVMSAKFRAHIFVDCCCKFDGFAGRLRTHCAYNKLRHGKFQ